MASESPYTRHGRTVEGDEVQARHPLNGSPRQNLLQIAHLEYGEWRDWRGIADENGLVDPIDLAKHKQTGDYLTRGIVDCSPELSGVGAIKRESNTLYFRAPGDSEFGVGVAFEDEDLLDLDGNPTDRVFLLMSEGDRYWVLFNAGNNAIPFTPSDMFVYTASLDDTVRKLNASDGELEWTFSGHTADARGVAVDPEGAVYTASVDNTARRVDAEGAEVFSFTGHTGDVVAVVCDATHMYTTSTDNSVLKINKTTGVEAWARSPAAGTASAPAVDDTHLYVGNEFGDTYKYEKDGTQVTSGWPISSGEAFVRAVAVDASHVYIGDSAGVIRKYEKDGTEITTGGWPNSDNGSLILGLSVDNNGNVYSASADVRKYDADGARQWVFSGHTAAVRSVAVGPSGNVYSCGDDSTVRKSSSSDGTELWKYTGHTDGVRRVVVAPGNFGAFQAEWSTGEGEAQITFTNTPQLTELIVPAIR